MEFRGTTICAVKRFDRIAIAGDGQVTMGENAIFKRTARKVRKIYNDHGGPHRGDFSFHRHRPRRE